MGSENRPKIRVLVADDESDMRDAYRQILVSAAAATDADKFRKLRSRLYQEKGAPQAAPSRPPAIQPCASTTAFIAPALVPLRPSNAIRPSSSNASSTPQVKAPCAPPPCSARFSRRGGDIVQGFIAPSSSSGQSPIETGGYSGLLHGAPWCSAYSMENPGWKTLITERDSC